MRQLSRRVPRRDAATRQSMGSEAGMLTPADDRVSSQLDGSRARSLSGSSALLLSRVAASESASAQGGTASSRANSSGLYSPTTAKGSATLNPPGTPRSGLSFGMQSHDPYYRPPRPRKKTLDTDASGECQPSSSTAPQVTQSTEDMDGPSKAPDRPPPGPKDDLDLDDPRPLRKDKDYAVREVDFYYRVRGPPLSHTGTRKLKTGPADPTGPVSSATGWFRNFFRGKTKDKGKGFEVVRSARAPPPGLFAEGEEFEEYHDEPEESTTRHASDNPPHHENEGQKNENPNDEVPTLPPLDSGGGIELPSRMGSQRSSHAPSISISRQNSARQPSTASSVYNLRPSLDAVAEATTWEPQARDQLQLQPTTGTGRLPFSAASSPSREHDYSVASTAPSTNGGSVRSRVERPSSMGYVTSHRTRDNIHEASPDQMSFSGSAAEWVDE